MAIDTVAIKPDDNIWIEFKDGLLNVLGQEETDIHERPSRLYFGRDERLCCSKYNFPYILPLEDLSKLDKSRFPLRYSEINRHTEARRTLTGGLQIRRNLEDSTPGFTRTATFSRKEHEIMKQYVK